MTNNWYVLTGGPSTGKTTLLAALEKRGHAVVQEAARTVIDEALAKGISPQELRTDEKRFQEDVARLKQRLEATLDPQTITFFDRGMHDTLAYMQHYGFVVEDWIEQLLRTSHYRKVFLLEPLTKFEDDYARVEGSEFVQSIHTLLYDAYAAFGPKPVMVPNMSVEERVNFVMNEVET